MTVDAPTQPLAALGEVARQRRLATAAAVFLFAIVVFSFVGPRLYHSDQVHTSLVATNLDPGNGHPLGTDQNGYDVLGRLMAGGQISLEIGVGVAVVATLVGALYGAIAGFFGSFLDSFMMRLVDVGLAVPAVLVLVLAAHIHRPTRGLLIAIVAALSWFGPARLIRGDTLVLRTREYVQAVATMGGTSWRAIFRHIIPNAAGTIIVTATFVLADSILVLAAIDFLGFGLPAPTATWGSMLSDGVSFLQDGYWWEVFPPLLAIALTVICCNVIGDALRDATNARLRTQEAPQP